MYKTDIANFFIKSVAFYFFQCCNLYLFSVSYLIYGVANINMVLHIKIYAVTNDMWDPLNILPCGTHL